jgi:hypothetical protein
LIRVDDKQAH